MDKQLLKQFHDQEHMRNEVHAFYKASLDEIVLSMVRNNVDTTNMNTAYTALDKAHTKLVNEFGTKHKTNSPSRAL